MPRVMARPNATIAVASSRWRSRFSPLPSVAEGVPRRALGSETAADGALEVGAIACLAWMHDQRRRVSDGCYPYRGMLPTCGILRPTVKPGGEASP